MNIIVKIYLIWYITSMTQEIILKRLSIIKHLFRLGEQQSQLPESIAYSSVLLFHDAIDMFNQLAAEIKGKTEKERKAITNGRSNLFMMEYFSLIPELTLEPSVKRINDRRNSLKHNGQIPSKIDVEESKVIANLFFEQNTPIIFGVEFKNISLHSLIQNDSVRRMLETAEEVLHERNFLACFQEVSKAFYELIHFEEFGYSLDSYSYYFLTQFKVNRSSYKTITPAFKKIKGQASDVVYAAEEFDNRLKSSLQDMNSNFRTVSDSFKIISLGIDYRKYVKFERLTPEVTRTEKTDGGYEYHVYSVRHEKHLTEQNCRFLIDFVLECALKFQEFEYQ
jgi:hypothetical protein